jgi:hypothetical protein
MPIRSAPLLLLFFALGCASDVQKYSVSVKNETTTGITLNLAKDVPQAESVWASPEDIDNGGVMVTPNTRLGIADVPPGKTGTVKDIAGHFPSGTHAVLRIYRGTKLLQRELLAMKPGKDRKDVLLKPGDNRFVIREGEAGLSVDLAP